MALVVVVVAACLILVALDILAWALVATIVVGLGLIALLVIGPEALIGMAIAAAAVWAGIAGIRHLSAIGALWVLTPFAVVAALGIVAFLAWDARGIVGLAVVVAIAAAGCAPAWGLHYFAKIGRRERLADGFAGDVAAPTDAAARLRWANREGEYADSDP